MIKFPKDFIWGAATSAYQIEGGAYKDGKGLSIWDVFCQEPNRIYNGQNGDITCDHYNRYPEDFALLAKLGIKNYRFSFSWTRLFPQGIGKINPEGLAFYDRLVDEMLKNDITPYATLFHWDYPYELFCRGGWLNQDSPLWFAEYTELIAKHFKDRIKHFFTLNEPQCFIGISTKETIHAPGIRFSNRDNLKMAHNVLLAHGHSVKVLRQNIKDVVVGYAPTGRYFHPTNNKTDDIEAARKATFDFTQDNWEFSVSWWSDPVILGHYPIDALEVMKDLMPNIKDGDMEIICQPLDILGQNIYHSAAVKGSDDSYEVLAYPDGHPKTAFNWPVTPQCLYWPLKYLYERYQLPLMITENGLSALDSVSLDNKVHDGVRCDYLQKHLLALNEALKEGVDIRGYFHWSLLDNFEWNSGYNERFGLVYVDFNSLVRIPKDSFYYYQRIIATNGKNLEEPWVI